MFPWLIFAVCAGALIAAEVPPSLEEVRKIANLEKRAGAALEYADFTIDTARKAYHAEDDKLYAAALVSVGDAAELSYRSLQETGKPARKNPKHFKRAELKLRQLIRRLDALEAEVDLDNRPKVAEANKRLHATHEQLLADIMTKK